MTILDTWADEITDGGIATPVPPEGLVLDHFPTVLELRVSQQGDKDLLYTNVRGAIHSMIDFYNSQRSELAVLSEVHVLDGFYLEGYVTIAERGAVCGQPVHLRFLELTDTAQIAQ